MKRNRMLCHEEENSPNEYYYIQHNEEKPQNSRSSQGRRGFQRELSPQQCSWSRRHFAIGMVVVVLVDAVILHSLSVFSEVDRGVRKRCCCGGFWIFYARTWAWSNLMAWESWAYMYIVEKFRADPLWWFLQRTRTLKQILARMSVKNTLLLQTAL